MVEVRARGKRSLADITELVIKSRLRFLSKRHGNNGHKLLRDREAGEKHARARESDGQITGQLQDSESEITRKHLKKKKKKKRKLCNLNSLVFHVVKQIL